MQDGFVYKQTEVEDDTAPQFEIGLLFSRINCVLQEKAVDNPGINL